MGRECLIINAYANKWVDYVIFESAWVTVSTGQSTGLKLQTIMNKEGTFFINKKKTPQVVYSGENVVGGWFCNQIIL